MQNLSISRGGKLAYVYRTGTEGKVIQVEVRHENGGTNWFHGGESERGIFIAINPVELSEGIVSFILGEGIKILALPLARRNDKQTTRVATVVDELVPELARQYEEIRAAQIARGVHYLSVKFPELAEFQRIVRERLGVKAPALV